MRLAIATNHDEAGTLSEDSMENRRVGEYIRQKLDKARAFTYDTHASISEKYGVGQALIDQTGEIVTQRTPYDEPHQFEEQSLRLIELVERYRQPKQFFLDLITKYGILKPERTGEYGARVVYEFRTVDVARIERVLHLRSQGYKMREIAHLMKNQEEYERLACELKENLSEWYNEPSADNWAKVLDVLSEQPDLSSIEKSVWKRVNKGVSFGQCAEEFALASIDEARDIFHQAEEKLGRTFLRLLYLGGKSS